MEDWNNGDGMVEECAKGRPSAEEWMSNTG